MIRKLGTPLAISVAVISFGFAVYHARTETQAVRRQFEREVQRSSDGLRVAVETLLEAGAAPQVLRVLAGFSARDGNLGAVLLDAQRQPAFTSPDFAERTGLSPAEAAGRFAGWLGDRSSGFTAATGRSVYFSGVTLRAAAQPFETLALLFDGDRIALRQWEIWRNALWRAALQSGLFAGAILLIVRRRITGPLARMTDWARDVRAGRTSAEAAPPLDESIRPLVQEVSRLATNLQTARVSANVEARLREAGDSLWTRERLKVFLERQLDGNRLFVVSNRQPYEHVWSGDKVEVRIPASGLVTAMEPVLQAADGTWIAHGAGTADRRTVDSHDRLPVPPDEPCYTLRRVWLTKEEEQGYYYGFANEGLWPLCHIAHTRPIFRPEDWEQYRAVNWKFAHAVADEMAGCASPLVLVQDYHFALLPAMIKQLRPDARVAIFWHIPWPNAEAFGICPWQTELLEGLLGADIVGFHTKAHCQNFLQTVDRALETRIDHALATITRGDRVTAVKPFPVSVEFAGSEPVASENRESLFRRFGPRVEFLGVGVDRLDYTKGIPERLLGIERFFEESPAYRERAVFVQIAAPTREDIPRYREIAAEVKREAERINRRFGTRDWSPIALLHRHHTHDEIAPYYQFADFCMVTSLHDGMNLVAKEYIASRADESGVLILSRFAGAAQELTDALIVNPYDVQAVAGTIRLAIEMDSDARRDRMRRMRQVVRERNVYWWAAKLVGATAQVRACEPAALLKA